MKKFFFLLCISINGIQLTQAQSFSDTLKKEIQFHLVPMFSSPATAFSAQIGYSHRFSKNNFLRTGVHIIQRMDVVNETINGLSGYNSYLETWKTGDPLIVNDSIGIGNSYGEIFRGSLFVGYEHLFGKGSTKFLLGVDLIFGLASYEGAYSVKNYGVAYVADTVAQKYNPNLTYINTESRNPNSIFFYAGISPRIGMRSDITKRFAISIVYAPQILLDTKSTSYGTLTNNAQLHTLGLPFSLDVGLHFKL